MRPIRARVGEMSSVRIPLVSVWFSSLRRLWCPAACGRVAKRGHFTQRRINPSDPCPGWRIVLRSDRARVGVVHPWCRLWCPARLRARRGANGGYFTQRRINTSDPCPGRRNVLRSHHARVGVVFIPAPAVASCRLRARRETRTFHPTEDQYVGSGPGTANCPPFGSRPCRCGSPARDSAGARVAALGDGSSHRAVDGRPVVDDLRIGEAEDRVAPQRQLRIVAHVARARR